MKKIWVDNKGFSLVELIIVIAIIAILSAAIAPALIRYINKARKADDIAAADTIGISVTAAVTDNEDMYEFLQWNMKELNGNRNAYRVLGYSNVGTGNTGQRYNSLFRANNIGGGHGDARQQGQMFADFMNSDLGDTLVKMRFTQFSKLDQWILCCDYKGNLSVWVGADMNGNKWTIDATTHRCGNSRQQYYMLWPQIDSEYQSLNKPSDVPD